MSDGMGVAKREERSPEKTGKLTTVIPSVDIYENNDELLLYADMPGVTKEDMTINLENGKLSIAGIRRLESGGTPQFIEFGAVEFRRNFSVPQGIDTNKVNAELKEGVLRLHLPKTDAVKPKHIEIKTG
jgi:HSP20 family protein